jgi:hypothetical protein
MTRNTKIMLTMYPVILIGVVEAKMFGGDSGLGARASEDASVGTLVGATTVIGCGLVLLFYKPT